MPKSPRTFATVVFCVLVAVSIAAVLVFFVERVNRNREAQALTDSKLLGLATLEYTQDHNNRYPDAGRWEQELKPYLDRNFKPGFGDIVHPPAPIGGALRRFSLNPAVAGKTETQISGLRTPWLFYESVSTQPSATDDLDNWPDPKRDGGTNFIVVYTEGYSYPRPPEWKQAVRQRLPGL